MKNSSLESEQLASSVLKQFASKSLVEDDDELGYNEIDGPESEIKAENPDLKSKCSEYSNIAERLLSVIIDDFELVEDLAEKLGLKIEEFEEFLDTVDVSKVCQSKDEVDSIAAAAGKLGKTEMPNVKVV